MKITAQKLQEIIADGLKKAEPTIKAAAAKAAAAARATGATSRAIGALNNPRTSSAKADAQAAEAARLMLTGPRHAPGKDEIQRAIGSPVPLRNLSDHDQVRAIMVASRGGK